MQVYLKVLKYSFNIQIDVEIDMIKYNIIDKKVTCILTQLHGNFLFYSIILIIAEKNNPAKKHCSDK